MPEDGGVLPQPVTQFHEGRAVASVPTVPVMLAKNVGPPVDVVPKSADVPVVADTYLRST